MWATLAAAGRVAATEARGCMTQRTNTNEDDDDVLTSPGGSRYDEAGDGELQMQTSRTPE